MKKEIIYSLKGIYREDYQIEGYRFGGGEKSACIVGALRGNEIQQLYICSQLVKALKELEAHGAISHNHEILVIPSVNRFSMNVGKRFWPTDNSDINRAFPGDVNGEHFLTELRVTVMAYILRAFICRVILFLM